MKIQFLGIVIEPVRVKRKGVKHLLFEEKEFVKTQVGDEIVMEPLDDMPEKMQRVYRRMDKERLSKKS